MTAFREMSRKDEKIILTHLAEEFRLWTVTPRSCNIGTYNSVLCATDHYSSDVIFGSWYSCV